MERRAFGKTDMQVSVLGFGGAEIGFQGASQKAVDEMLTAAIDAGLNVIDTAECYVNSEELIGHAIGHRRREFYLFTKCGHGDNYNDHKWGGEDIARSIDRSLKRLQTDYVDLIQLHSCTEEVLKRGEVIAVLKEAKKAGKTRYIGYSGDSTDAVYAIKTGEFDALQTSISIADQEAIDLLLPLAREYNLGVIAKRPIANAVWRHKSTPDKDDYSRPYWDRLQELKYDFINGDDDLSAETALRFTLSVPGVHTMIVGTSRPGRWQDNARVVAKGKLPPHEYDSIRKRWHAVATKQWVGQV
ncbi:MAG TPA: aldo/keto reductase [Candidatus Obscuribacterales bacterium]